MSGRHIVEVPNGASRSVGKPSSFDLVTDLKDATHSEDTATHSEDTDRLLIFCIPLDLISSHILGGRNSNGPDTYPELLKHQVRLHSSSPFKVPVTIEGAEGGELIIVLRGHDSSTITI